MDLKCGTVTLKIYTDYVKSYHKQTFICQHRTHGTRPGSYSTIEAHLPEKSQHYGKWNSTRYSNLASRIGPNDHTVIRSYGHTVISRLFDQGPEQQSYRRVHAILKMANTYSDQRLDTACHYSLERSTHSTLNLIKQLVEHSMT